MPTSPEIPARPTLGSRGQTIHRAVDDICGREVRDRHGDRIGTVADLVLDDREEEVRFLVVDHGGVPGFGDAKTLIPVDALVRITSDEVFVGHSERRRRGRAGLRTGPRRPSIAS